MYDVADICVIVAAVTCSSDSNGALKFERYYDSLQKSNVIWTASNRCQMTVHIIITILYYIMFTSVCVYIYIIYRVHWIRNRGLSTIL